MQPSTRYKFANAVWYQIFWFTALLGRENWEPLLFLLLGLHFVFSPRKKADLFLVFACGSIGIFADSALATAGVFVFSPEPSFLPIPIWLAAIWLAFCCTLLHSFNFFVARPLAGPIVISLLAPLSYLAGERFGAISFGIETSNAMLVIAGSWLVVMSLIAALTRKVDQLSQHSDGEIETSSFQGARGR